MLLALENFPESVLLRVLSDVLWIGRVKNDVLFGMVTSLLQLAEH